MRWLLFAGAVGLSLLTGRYFAAERQLAQEPSSLSTLRRLFRGDEPLNDAQIARLLEASYGEVNQQTFRATVLNPPGSDAGYEFQMGPAGLPRYMHAMGSWSEAFVDYTGRAAYSCTGVSLGGEYVLAYATAREGLNPADTPGDAREGWLYDGAGGKIKVQARVRDSRDLLSEVFEMYRNERPLTVGRRAMVDGHIARPLMTHHELRPADPLSNPVPYPADLQDHLWLDVDSLFLVRWDIRRAGVSNNNGYVFTHTPGVALHPPSLPKGAKIPSCVE
jgi:hypothetical protein